MSVVKVFKGGVELSNESGGANFVTDWHKSLDPTARGKKLTLTAQFLNDLNQVETMVLEVSNDPDTVKVPLEKISVGTDEGVEEEINWRFWRFSYEIQGATPTGVIEKIEVEVR